MKLDIFSYRFAEEITQHQRHNNAWNEIRMILEKAPLFIYPKKSGKNPHLDVVQQLMNTYFDRVFVLDHGWDFHPLATNIVNSGLKADYRKKFGDLVIQAEVQFGNMSRWYSDVFKFQAAYSQAMIKLGLSVIPSSSLARRIDSNIVNFERAKKELPSAELSLTLPILMIGLDTDQKTEIVDVSKCQFQNIRDITGMDKSDNQWRIINSYLAGMRMEDIGSDTPIGQTIDVQLDSDSEE